MVGKVTTEGDRAMSSDLARLSFGLDGSGIKIGIISNSFNILNGATTDVLSGDLPGAGNPNGYTTPVRVLREGEPDDIDEGRAMAQIIHDVAPGAELLFYTGPNVVNEDEYVQAINALVDAEVDVIVDDVSLIQPLFQDGKVAQAVDGAVSRGIAYFGAAGNSGSITYESPFRASQTITINGQQYIAHDFDSGAGVNTRQKIDFLSDGASFAPYLQWSQPFNQPTTRLELFLFDEAGNLLIGPPNNDGPDRSGGALSDAPNNFGQGAAISFWNRTFKAGSLPIRNLSI